MKKSDRTRQLIIEKAAPLFNTKGVAGTSISDIMEATSLAKGGVYGNFSSKDEITIAAFDHLAELLKGQLSSITAPVRTMRGKLEALFTFYSKYPLDPLIAGGCPILNFGVEADDTHPQLRKRVSKLITYLQERIALMVNIGIDRGEFRKDWNAEQFAVKMFTMLEGATLISRVNRNNKQMKIIIAMLRTEMEYHTL